MRTLNSKITLTLISIFDLAVKRNATLKDWNDRKRTVVLNIIYLSRGASPPIVRRIVYDTYEVSQVSSNLID